MASSGARRVRSGVLPLTATGRVMALVKVGKASIDVWEATSGPILVERLKQGAKVWCPVLLPPRVSALRDCCGLHRSPCFLSHQYITSPASPIYKDNLRQLKYVDINRCFYLS